MAYIGANPQTSLQQYLTIDDISGDFDGIETSFALLVGGVAPVPGPSQSNQLLISLGGVIQEPDDTGSAGFRLSGGNIIFSSAPAGSTAFFGVVLAGADYIYAGTNFPDGSATSPSITFANDLDTGLFRNGSGELAYTANGTFRLLIDSSGRLLVGTSSTSGQNAGLQIASATGQYDSRNAELFRFDATNDTSGPTLYLTRSKSDTIGTIAAVNADDGLGEVRFAGAGDASTYLLGASIRAFVDTGTVSATSMPTYLAFATTADGASSPTERMRIDSSGRLLVGTDTALTAPAGSRLTVAGDDFATSSITGIRYQENTNGPSLLLMAANGTEASPTSVSGDDELGKIRFYGHDGTDFASFGASIECRVDNTPSENVVPGRLQFWTTDAVGGINERMRIGSNGEVRIIGTMEADANNAYNLVIRGDDGGNTGESAQIFLGGINSSTRGAVIAAEVRSTSNNHDMLFKVSAASSAPTERMRLRHDGRLLIGTNATIGTDRLLQVADTSAEAGAELIRYVAADSSAPVLSLAKSRGTSVGSNVAVTDNDICGYIQFKGNNGTEFLNAAWITGEIDGEPNTGGDTTDMPGRLVFSTTPNGSSSASERMRITNAGNIRLPSGSPGIQFDGNTAADDSLSDYEEGTWTPGLTFGSGNAGMTFGTQDGHYVKVGKVVHCTFIFTLSNKGTSTGVALLTGLPHQVGDELTSTSLEGGGLLTYADNISGTISPPYSIACAQLSTTAQLFASPNSNEFTTNLNNSNFENNTSVRGVFTYFAG